MDQWRITLLGDGAVGKTAIAIQFQRNCFVANLTFIPQTYDPTIEDAYRKQLMVDDIMCFAEVIDTAGQEEYSTLRDQWIRAGQGFILVYSITSRNSFDRLHIYRQNILKVKRSQSQQTNSPTPTVFVIVGNKSDLSYQREVSREEGSNLAKEFGCEFMETSAKTATNVDRLFMTLVRNLRGAYKGVGGPDGSGGGVDPPLALLPPNAHGRGHGGNPHAMALGPPAERRDLAAARKKKKKNGGGKCIIM